MSQSSMLFRWAFLTSILFYTCSCHPSAPFTKEAIDMPQYTTPAPQSGTTQTGLAAPDLPALERESSVTPTTALPISNDAEGAYEKEAPFTATPTGVHAFCSGKPVLLDIPDRDEDDEAPEEGWCGETSIQMALAYYGKQVSQHAINLAGKPQHPDLWEDDINTALNSLGVKYTAWNSSDADVDAFLSWIGENLQAGYPVILGVKIYPDEHPDWEIDHFVLVVGCDERGIVINTNNAGEGQIHVSYSELTSDFEDSYSIINRQKYLFGRAIQGLR